MKQIEAVVKKISDKEGSRTEWQIFAMITFFVGIFLFPIYLRAPALKSLLGNFRYINFLAIFATLLLLSTRPRLEQREKLLVAMWMLAVALAVWSNAKSATHITVTAFFQNMFPLLLLLCRIDKKCLNRICKYTLYAYDIFIVMLLLLAVYERFAGYPLIQMCYNRIGGHDLDVMQYMALTENRFASIWGHALTNALFFNVFFILNDCYYKAVGKKYPKLLFFFVALAGVLLTASKTAVVVLGVYFLITSYKDKRIMFVCVIGIVIFVAIGGFDTLLERFMSGPLTTGRFQAMKWYFESGIYPIRISHGYGTSTVFSADVSAYRAAFEFPTFMFALDYGIIFSVIYFGSLLAYMSYRLIKWKQYTLWVGFMGLFAEINTYNGISIKSHDICFIFCLVCMLLLNMSRLTQENEKGC